MCSGEICIQFLSKFCSFYPNYVFQNWCSLSLYMVLFWVLKWLLYYYHAEMFALKHTHFSLVCALSIAASWFCTRCLLICESCWFVLPELWFINTNSARESGLCSSTLKHRVVIAFYTCVLYRKCLQKFCPICLFFLQAFSSVAVGYGKRQMLFSVSIDTHRDWKVNREIWLERMIEPHYETWFWNLIKIIKSVVLLSHNGMKGRNELHITAWP